MNCSFCEKSDDKVFVLIARNVTPSYKIGICNECVTLCLDIMIKRIMDKVDSFSKKPLTGS